MKAKVLTIIFFAMFGFSKAQAETKNVRKISGEEFVSEIQGELKEHGFEEGLIDGGSASCFIRLEVMTQNRVSMSIRSENAQSLIKTTVPRNAEIVLTENLAEDGSYSKIYKMNNGAIKITNMNDAYYTVALKTTTSALTCGLYY